MAKRLVDNMNSLYIGAANRLKSKKARKKIIAYVESYDDILFWRNVLSAYENVNRYFEVMLPSRTTLNRGKKPAMMNVLNNSLGESVIACVDADYDYLIQGATTTSKQMLENPFIFHTYAYAIENYQCNASNLHEVCVMATLNDHELVDLKSFYQLYSQIVYPLFAWNVYFYRQKDLKSFSILTFCNAARIDTLKIEEPAKTLEKLQRRIERKVTDFETNYPELVADVEEVKKELYQLGVYPENTYYFIQGHHLFENVTMKVLSPICAYLRREREDEIKALATHETQLQNELTSYEHSQCSVELMLKKNRSITNCEPFEKLKRDLEKYLSQLN